MNAHYCIFLLLASYLYLEGEMNIDSAKITQPLTSLPGASIAKVYTFRFFAILGLMKHLNLSHPTLL